MNYIDKIERTGACFEALRWLRKEKYRTLEEAWRGCKRSDWMYWLISRCPYPDTAGNRKKHRLLACEHARAVLPIWEKRYPDDHRPRLAIEAAERYARKPTEANATARSAARIAARRAADSAARSTAEHAAADTAAGAAESAARRAAEHAARSAVVSAGMSAAADTAESAADSAAVIAAWNSADSAARKQQADAIRRYFPKPPKLTKVGAK